MPSGVRSIQKMTPQFLLKKLKRRLGAKTLRLSMSDTELLDILYEETLPVFSIYFPRVVPMKFELSGLEDPNYITESEMQKAYRLPIPNNLNVFDVQDIEYFNNTLANYWNPAALGFQNSFDVFYSEVEQGMLESMMSTPIVKEFQEPNLLIVDEPGYMCSKAVRITFLAVHTPDLSSIPYTYMEWLFDLFVVDAKIALYEDMKHYDKTDTTFQSIDLKIDDWNNAYQERDQLIEKFDSNSILHRKKKIYRL